MPGISIALATFNGEKYLAAQLESLAAQTTLPSELVVSDDCSEDATVRLVRDFAGSAPFPVRILSHATRLGFRDNFMRAVAHCRAELVAFCDQDDVWEPDKLSVMAPVFRDPDVLLVYHNASLIDANGRLTGRLYRSGAEAIVTYPPLSRHPWLVVPGFTQVFRRDLMRFAGFHAASRDADWPEETLAHDRWFFLLASVFGQIVFLGRPLVRYRQHHASTFGRYSDARAHFDRLVRGEHFAATAATAARNRSELLRQMQDRVPDRWQERRLNGIAYYEALAHRLEQRSAVYAASSFGARLEALYRLFRQGAYGKAHGSARFNWSELLMDAYVGLPFGPRLQRLFRWVVSKQYQPSLADRRK